MFCNCLMYFGSHTCLALGGVGDAALWWSVAPIHATYDGICMYVIAMFFLLCCVVLWFKFNDELVSMFMVFCTPKCQLYV